MTVAFDGQFERSSDEFISLLKNVSIQCSGQSYRPEMCCFIYLFPIHMLGLTHPGWYCTHLDFCIVKNMSVQKVRLFVGVDTLPCPGPHLPKAS